MNSTQARKLNIKDLLMILLLGKQGLKSLKSNSVIELVRTHLANLLASVGRLFVPSSSISLFYFGDGKTFLKSSPFLELVHACFEVHFL